MGKLMKELEDILFNNDIRLSEKFKYHIRNFVERIERDYVLKSDTMPRPKYCDKCGKKIDNND